MQQNLALHENFSVCQNLTLHGNLTCAPEFSLTWEFSLQNSALHGNLMNLFT